MAGGRRHAGIAACKSGRFKLDLVGLWVCCLSRPKPAAPFRTIYHAPAALNLKSVRNGGAHFRFARELEGTNSQEMLEPRYSFARHTVGRTKSSVARASGRARTHQSLRLQI